MLDLVAHLPPLRLSPREFADLPEYSRSLPTATTPGKRWKRLSRSHDMRFAKLAWMVGEYGKPEGNSVPIYWYRPVIVIRAATTEAVA